MEGWSSKRCALIWKIQGTQYNRIYYQLLPSAHPTDATEFGLLLTPTTSEQVQDLDKFKARMAKYPNGTTMPNLATQVVGLLPTPTTDERDAQYKQGGTNLRAAVRGLLPTPTSCDYNTARSPEAWEKAKEKHGSALQKPLKQLAKDGMLPTPIAQTSRGTPDSNSSQLNPRFVAEMMGFPVNWTELPFLSGEQKA
jgi:hypothetical protein